MTDALKPCEPQQIPFEKRTPESGEWQRYAYDLQKRLQAAEAALARVREILGPLVEMGEKATPEPWDIAMFGDGMCLFRQGNGRERVVKESRDISDQSKLFRWLGRSPEREVNIKFIKELRNALPLLAEAVKGGDGPLPAAPSGWVKAGSTPANGCAAIFDTPFYCMDRRGQIWVHPPLPAAPTDGEGK